MIREDKPIECRCCGKHSGHTEQEIMHLVLPPTGLRCRNCGEVYVRSDRAEWVFADV